METREYIVCQVLVVLALAAVAGCHVAALAASPRDSTTEEGTVHSFAGEGNAEAAEEALAEGRTIGSMAVRLRLRTRSLRVGQARLYQRLEWQPTPNLGAFLLTERDPGERQWVDFWSAHLRWERGPVAVVAGDLRPGFAQGLVFSRASGRGGVPPASPRRDSQSLGYRSTGENAALRGLCLRLQRSGLRVTGVAGQLAWDARIREDGSVSSLPESGLHVSPSEMASRDRLRGRVLGLRLLSAGRDTHLGITLQKLQFERVVDLRRPDRSPIEFHGRSQWLVATDILHESRSWRGFADIALAPSGEWASVGGVRTSLSRVRVCALIRHYSPGFHSFFGGAASAAGMDDETGILITARGRGWKLYVDEYRRAQRTYTHPLPGPTQVWGAEGHRRLGAGWTCLLAQQHRHKPRWSNEVSIWERDRRTRADLVWARASGPRVRLRAEVRHVGRSGGKAELGTLYSARGRWRGIRTDWTVHATRFSTPSYASRIYEYERSLPGTVSIPPLYGQGWRAAGALEITWSGGSASVRYRHQRQARWHRPQHAFGVQLDFAAGRLRP